MLTLMCSNRVIVDNLEWCLEDLVECFDNFLRKSLIVLSVGIGIIVGLLCYLLKMVSERSLLNSPGVVSENTSNSQNKVNEKIYFKNLEQTVNAMKKCEENEDMNTDNINFKKDSDKKICPEIKPLEIPTSPSFEESLLRDVSLSACSKNVCGCDCNKHLYLTSRAPVPNLSTSSSKHKLTPGLRKRPLNKRNLSSLQLGPKLKQESCCSMCCSDEPKGEFV